MSDSEDETHPTTEFKPTYVLIAIDSGPLMFVKKEDDSTPFRDCVNACYHLANSLMFTTNKRSWSPFGVVFANEDSKASFVNFSDGVLKTIKSLKAQTDLSDDDLESLHQRKTNLDLSAFFLFCKKKFKEVKSVFYKRVIVYITNDDNPTRGDKNQRFAVINEAKNFEANGITFEMVTMNPDFNYTLFYNELFSVMKTPLVETLVEDEDGLQEKLSSLILTRYHQRKMHFFPFVGDESRFLKVRQKSYVKRERLYNNAHVSSQGKTLKKIFKTIADASKKYIVKHPEETVELDLEEYMEILNTNVPVGYSLLHVSDRVTEVGLVMTENLILENDPKEDLPYFDSFWQYCADKNKVLVCARKLAQNGNIRFVEFIPKFANNTRIFMVKGIPFQEEHKNPGNKLQVEEASTDYSKDKIEVTDELINNLSFDYDPKMFVDPVNAKKKAFLRSKLLDEEKEDVEDVTLDNEGIDNSLMDIGDSFRRLFGLDEEIGAKKRKPAASRATASKRKK